MFATSVGCSIVAYLRRVTPNRPFVTADAAVILCEGGKVVVFLEKGYIVA